MRASVVTSFLRRGGRLVLVSLPKDNADEVNTAIADVLASRVPARLVLQP